MALLALGCGRGRRPEPRPQPGATTPTSAPAKGQGRSARRGDAALVLQVDALGEDLSPLVEANGRWVQRLMLDNVVEPLLRVENRSLLPHLAREQRWEPERKRIVLALQQGARFHDGRPLTSADVRYTLDTLRKKQHVAPFLAQELATISQIDDPAPHTVHVYTVAKDPDRILTALTEVGIVPAHRHRRFGLASPSLNRVPMGSGPYRVAPRPRGVTSLTLLRNDDYWGRAPAYARIEVRVIGDRSRALSALRNSEIDVLPALFWGYYPDQLRGPRFARRFESHHIQPFRLRVVLFNQARKSLKDRRVRVAIIHALDRRRIAQQLRGQLARVLSAPLWPLSPHYDRKLHPRSFSPQKAAQLLDAAGYPRAKSGKRHRLGHPLALRILCAADPLAKRAAALVLKDLRAAGITSELDVADFGTMSGLLRRGRFDLAVAGIALSPQAHLDSYLHSKGRFNYGRYSNETVDRLLDHLSPLREPTSAGAGSSLHRTLVADPPLVVLYAAMELMLSAKRVGGLRDDGLWPPLWRLFPRPEAP